MGDLVEPDQWVWIPDEEDCYIPAKAKGAFHIGEPCQVLSEDGEDVKLDSSKDVLPLNEEVLNHNIDNLINFKDLNERALLHNLRQRFKHDLIYTYVSSILISVNPFKLLPIYTPEVLESYRQGSRGKSPHVFAIADNAYNNMVNEQKDQSVVISGESGAGKSEATKLILQYIAEASSRASGIRAKENSLEQQILQSNPIMEAFGNAKTVRNNNSSRFGKLITVYFDGSGSVSGGSIISYLLEKSRVVGQSEGERNYHIFYQLIAGGEAYPQLKQELSLDSASMFQYTNQSGVDKIPGVSDEKDFEEVKSAMDTLNITEEEQMNVFRTVAAVLHSGNLKFDKVENSTSEDGSKIANDECTQIVAKLLSVDEDVLNTVLTSKRMGTRSVVIVPYTKSQAMQARDAMTKAVYSKLFDWLMSKINLTLSGGKEHDKSHKMIGVLDIFGFESFEHNSFEQLCINYCNEKLQFHFNEHIFRLEQEVYAAEGVNVPATDFKDNSATLSLLEAKAQGIFFYD
jgi:myosin heavy subunit